jgi:hypothetical protein
MSSGCHWTPLTSAKAWLYLTSIPRLVMRLALTDSTFAISSRKLRPLSRYRGNVARCIPSQRKQNSRSAASALTQTDGTGQRSSFARISSADLVQTKGLGLALCSAR